MLDRTREDGAVGQPMFLDANASFSLDGVRRNVVGGQYGLASKEFTPKVRLCACGVGALIALLHISSYHSLSPRPSRPPSLSHSLPRPQLLSTL